MLALFRRAHVARVTLAVKKDKTPDPMDIKVFGAYRYSLALIVDGECVLRYDNERGKGDHRHFRDQESAYAFVSMEQLMDDFQAEV